ncbi:MAG: hypothetical protein LUC43_05640 [Burkholderiales bacterium]|nr:hypothetical protein [Burkholderiales bacterium]
MVDTKIVQCPADKIRKLAEEDAELLWLLCSQLESCCLSDRFSFGCQGILGSEDKIKAFICGWTANYGTVLLDKQNPKVRIPLPPPYKLLGKICSVNWLIVKGIFNKWKDEGDWGTGEDSATISPNLLSDIYKWLTREGKEFYPLGYPKTLQDLLELKKNGPEVHKRLEN